MQQYVIDGVRSRGFIDLSYIQCELGLDGCLGESVDCHHIESSMRGKRKHKKDGSDIIFLCRKCHEKIHAKNDFETRQNLLKVVEGILYFK